MGIIIAIFIITLWILHLTYMFLYVEFALSNPWMYLHILIQTYLYTGLFITGHDAMHATISRNPKINKTLGILSVFLFAGMSYKRLGKNHGLHHKNPASSEDPDYYTKSGNVLTWWGVFMWRYITIGQLIIMAIAFNILVHLFGLDQGKVIIYWAVPAILGTLQLFSVGVYWPHRLPHTHSMMPHKARTQQKNHIWAMISCYFFGYHWEHHQNPGIPWWQLYKTKSDQRKLLLKL